MMCSITDWKEIGSQKIGFKETAHARHSVVELMTQRERKKGMGRASSHRWHRDRERRISRDGDKERTEID